MKTAIVHDWLTIFAGAERVLEQLFMLHPECDIFATVDFLKEQERAFLRGKKPKTSFIQNLPFASRYFRNYLALMPMAVEQHDLSEYELIISSNYACAKGVITRPDQLHVCYIHTPARYAWDLQEAYLTHGKRRHGAKDFLIRAVLHYLRQWDRLSADRVDLFVANSHFVASRVEKFYRRRSIVVNPPVDTERFQMCDQKEDYYVTVGRLVPYKRTDLVVEAFSTRLKNKRLVVVGDGPEMERIRQIAGPNVELLGHQPEHALTNLVQHARAFVYAGVEDFGISTVEAQACGTPVIALGRGGTLDIVVPDRTGVLFPEQSVPSLLEAISEFECRTFDPTLIRKNAERFRPERFRSRMTAVIERAIQRREIKKSHLSFALLKPLLAVTEN